MTYPPDIIAAAQATGRPKVAKGPFPSATLAQWRLESNWGKALSGKNNYFGIKANRAQIDAGNATSRWTQEFTTSEYVKVMAWFADYPTVEACFAAHTTLLTTPHYLACQNAPTTFDYCRALQKCGYATAPNYADVLISIIQSNKLDQYDNPPSQSKDHPPMPAETAPTISIAPATPVSPARVVPTSTQPVRIAWGDWLEQYLVHETPLLEKAAQVGFSVGAAAIPGGIGSIMVGMLGPTIVKQAVDGILVAVEGSLSGAAIEFPASGLAAMAGNMLNATLPTFVAKAGSLLDGWLEDVLAKVDVKG